MLTWCSGLMFVCLFLSKDFSHDSSRVIERVWKSMCWCVCVLCGCVCGFMYLREHHFKTNSLQRKQSPLDRHKVSMSNIWTKKKSYLCYESYAPAIRYCRCYSWCSWRSLWGFSRLGVWSLSLLCSFSGTLNTEGGWRCRGWCEMVIRQKLFQS